MSCTAKIHQPFIKMNKYLISLRQLAPVIAGIIVVFAIMACFGCTQADRNDNIARNMLDQAFQMCKSGTGKVLVGVASGVQTTTLTCQVDE
jgi:ABC-type multidrug transport system permease subunit